MARSALVGQVHHVRFHRNGVGGTGFYTVRFEYAPTGEDLIAVVPLDGGSEAYVVSLEDPEQGWRGTDDFRPELLEAIRASGWPYAAGGEVR